MITRRKLLATAAILTAANASTVLAQNAAILSGQDRFHPIVAENGMVAAQEKVAAQVGVDILKAGGNAVDASVAVAFALAVTLPRAGNLGGGGFMIVHDAEKGDTQAIDYREMAPKAAFKDMYLDEAGEVVKNRSRFHGLAIGVPGTVAGMALALERNGSMTMAQVVAPAITLARDGIVVTQSLSDGLKSAQERLKRWPQTAKVFYKPDGGFYEVGDVFKQPDLAATLQSISDHGTDGFYKGDVAEKIAAGVQAADGVITTDDMEAYKSVVRDTSTGTYRGYDIHSMPPPSSGGTHIVQILNTLEGYPIGKMGHNSATTIHLMAEAMKQAYADRATYLGDPDFVDVPVQELTDKAYANDIRAKINMGKARPAELVKANVLTPYESNETTHFSVIDRFGNAVSNTYTINFSFGSGIVADGTGVLMNNEMDDFSAKTGVANAYGLIGGDANAVEAGKRPLSSMSPTIVMKDGKVFLVTGSPGGSRIITTTLQILMNVIDHGMNIAEATYAPRIHHQWLPDELRVEEGISADTKGILRAKGHDVVVKRTMGSTQSIMIDGESGVLLGATDPRRPGSSVEGY
ncbi:gamma-glutamyltransferase [Amylibacter sp. SFDW26]|uniref:gamma-glutamyltransferase n=1 Tax=Amylibacter sp. SFDW26 TaxID=2652722 RepID=UPI001261EBC6|nr:gamma-glutamyltransferase [Amylibacter sp. SFDW26]KAB7615447.1 gamma-glutamyltransferase [Amylibacter sp. SFDW26]